MDGRCVNPLAYDNRPIGVFDSGLGGLTVARSIATSLSHESIYYVGDTKRCPYGPRSENEVRTFALQAGRWLEAHDVKIIVIACNTATAAALTVAQQTLDVPVIGVIAPGARAAINTTRTRKVGVLATELTVRSGAYTRAIQSLDAGVDVYGCPAPSFVNIVERELATGAHLQERWLEDGDIFDTPEIRFEDALADRRYRGGHRGARLHTFSAACRAHPPCAWHGRAGGVVCGGDHARAQRHPAPPRTACRGRCGASAPVCNNLG